MKKSNVLWAAAMVVLAVFLAVPAVSQWAEITTNKIKQADTTKPISIETDGDGVRIGSSTTPGSAMSQFRSYMETLTPSAIGANACGSGNGTIICSTVETYTVTGLATTDKVFVNPPAFTAAFPGATRCPYVHANVSAANTLRLTFAVLTNAACTPTAGVYNIFSIRVP